MINLKDKYGSRALAPSAEYPNGSFKNETIPDTSNDGTPLDKLWGDDFNGFSERLLIEGGVAASGNPDTALASDRFDAMKNIIAADVLAKPVDFSNTSGTQNGNAISDMNAWIDARWVPDYSAARVIPADAQLSAGDTVKIANYTDHWVVENIQSGATDNGFILLLASYPTLQLRSTSRIYSIDIFGAQGAPADDSAAVLAAHNYVPAGSELVFPPTESGYKLDLLITKSISIDLGGNKIIPASTSGGIFRCAGQLSATSYQFVSNYNRGAINLETTVAAADISAGDLVLITDNLERPSDSARINYEPHIIGSASGASLMLQVPLRFKKTSTAGNIAKIIPVDNVVIKNGRLEDTALQGNYGALFQYTKNVRFENIIVSQMSFAGFEIQYSYGVSVKNCQIIEPRATGSNQGNGVVLFGCRECEVDIYTSGTRHALDLSSAFDVCGKAIAERGEEVDFYIAHNSVGGYIGSEGRPMVLRSYSNNSASRRAAAASAQGVYSVESDQYSVDIANVNIDLDVATKDRAANQIQMYFEIPCVDSSIIVTGTCSNGVGGTAANIQLCRFTPVQNRNVKLWISCKGFDIPINYSSFASAEFTPSNLTDGITVMDLTADYYYDALSYDYASVVDIRGGTLSNAQSVSSNIVKRNVSSTVLLSRLRMENLTKKGVSGNFHNLASSRTSDDCQGQITSLVTDQSVTNLVLAAAFIITMEQLGNKDMGDGTINVEAAGTVTSATSAFAQGLYQGQRIRLVNNGTQNIIVQNAGIVVNNSSADLTIGPNKTASWVFSKNVSSGLWREV